MFSYFIIGNVTLKSEQTLTSAVYGYTYSKLSMSEINACYMQVNLNYRNYIWFYKMPIILCKFSNSFLLSNDTEDTECHNNLELQMVIKNEFTSIFATEQ